MQVDAFVHVEIWLLLDQSVSLTRLRTIPARRHFLSPSMA